MDDGELAVRTGQARARLFVALVVVVLVGLDSHDGVELRSPRADCPRALGSDLATDGVASLGWWPEGVGQEVEKRTIADDRNEPSL